MGSFQFGFHIVYTHRHEEIIEFLIWRRKKDQETLDEEQIFYPPQRHRTIILKEDIFSIILNQQ
jgi:hypothetical protein